MLALRIPVLCSLCDLFLGADHLKVSGFLLRGLIDNLGRADNLNMIVRGLSITPFLSPLFHGILSDLLSFLFFLELVLGALSLLSGLVLVEILSTLDHTSRLRRLFTCMGRWLG